MNLRTIQDELPAWKKKNFPGEQTHHPLLGVVEEFSELVEARSARDKTAVKDAIGDLSIFLVDLCRRHFLDAQAIFDSAAPAEADEYSYSGAVKVLGRLCRAQLKLEQKIRGTSEEHVQTIVANVRALFSYLLRVRSDVEEIAWATWLEVRERDWTANPSTGRKEITQ